jgi:hypothetical protein
VGAIAAVIPTAFWVYASILLLTERKNFLLNFYLLSMGKMPAIINPDDRLFK